MTNPIFLFVLAIISSYLIGCISTGYYLVLLFKKNDIRTMGSNSTGATNVGRLLGKKGFAITFIIDVLKGVLVAVLCGQLQFTQLQNLGCLLALICGHILPIQLKFKGGKGVAVLTGFALAWNWPMLLIALTIAGILLLLTKKFTLSGLIGMLAFPIYGWYLHLSWPVIGLLSFNISVIYWAHRENFQQLVKSK